jgi:hypothetical protein
MEYSQLLARTEQPDFYERIPSAEPIAGSPALRLPPSALEETLVADTRATLTPAEMVERKLLSLLKSNPLPVSHRMDGPGTRRHHA